MAVQLNALGLGRGDRVAIVLPNGPEMATAFVAVAAAASTAPLNPAYRADELDFYLTDIGAADVGEHKTSMLQDLERGRPMEIDALVTAVQELGRLTGQPTPPSTMCWRWCAVSPSSAAAI